MGNISQAVLQASGNAPIHGQKVWLSASAYEREGIWFGRVYLGPSASDLVQAVVSSVVFPSADEATLSCPLAFWHGHAATLELRLIGNLDHLPMFGFALSVAGVVVWASGDHQDAALVPMTAGFVRIVAPVGTPAPTPAPTPSPTVEPTGLDSTKSVG